MSDKGGTKSQHAHNKSLLYSNRPKFKENIRENIYVDKIRTDGIAFEKVDKEQLEKVLAQIRIKAKREVSKQRKIFVISFFITIVIVLSLNSYLDQKFSQYKDFREANDSEKYKPMK